MNENDVFASREMERIFGTAMAPEPFMAAALTGENFDADEIEFEGQLSQDGIPENPDCSSDALPLKTAPAAGKKTLQLPDLVSMWKWIESVFAFLSSEAISHGVPIPGYKVVEGRSKRVFTDTKAVVDTAIQNGYTDLYKQQLITLTEFEKMMGKKRFAELLGDYVAKTPGKLVLVPENDPRPPASQTNIVINTAINAANQEFAVQTDS